MEDTRRSQLLTWTMLVTFSTVLTMLLQVTLGFSLTEHWALPILSRTERIGLQEQELSEVVTRPYPPP